MANKLSFPKKKQKYDRLMKEEADHQARLLTKDLAEHVIYNKYELHDTRILVGVLVDLLIRKKIISKEEIGRDIIEAYEDELKAHKPKA